MGASGFVAAQAQRFPYIDEQGRESLNFHISWWIYGLLIASLWITIILIPLAWILGGILYVLGIIYTVMGAIAASNGRPFTYPWTIRFL